MREGEDYYIDDLGRLVMTADYHRRRGYCCGSGCRHCPYDYINVDEPNRQLLIKRTSAKNSSSNES